MWLHSLRHFPHRFLQILHLFRQFPRPSSLFARRADLFVLLTQMQLQLSAKRWPAWRLSLQQTLNFERRSLLFPHLPSPLRLQDENFARRWPSYQPQWTLSRHPWHLLRQQMQNFVPQLLSLLQQLRSLRQLWNFETQSTRFQQRQLQMQKRHFVRFLLQLGLFLQKFSQSLHLPALFQHQIALTMRLL
jgi:hypothetical protein